MVEAVVDDTTICASAKDDAPSSINKAMMILACFIFYQF